MRAVLAIDTAFAACNIAVWDAQTNHITRLCVAMERGQAEQLVPLINECLKTAGITYADLGLIVPTLGPGSFTGIRVGLSTAIGISLARALPVQGVPTTELFFRAQNQCDAIVALDTKRGDFYTEIFKDGVGQGITVRSRVEVEKTNLPIVGDMNGPAFPDMGVAARLGAEIYQNKAHPLHGTQSPIYARGAEISVAKRFDRVPLDPAALAAL